MHITTVTINYIDSQHKSTRGSNLVYLHIWTIQLPRLHVTYLIYVKGQNTRRTQLFPVSEADIMGANYIGITQVVLSILHSETICIDFNGLLFSSSWLVNTGPIPWPIRDVAETPYVLLMANDCKHTIPEDSVLVGILRHCVWTSHWSEANDALASALNILVSFVIIVLNQ
jgi:hypothetical protein